MASLDSELRDDSQSLESSQLLTPVDKTSSVPPKIISVICGSVSGELYLDKLSNRSSSKLGGIKCVLSDSSWYSLTEFESLGGKAKSKNWRKSVTVADTTSNLVLFSNLLDLLVLRPLLLHLVMLVLLLLDPSIHNPGL